MHDTNHHPRCRLEHHVAVATVTERTATDCALRVESPDCHIELAAGKSTPSTAVTST